MHHHIILDKLHISNVVTYNFTAPGQYIMTEEYKKQQLKKKVKTKSQREHFSAIELHELDIELQRKK